MKKQAISTNNKSQISSLFVEEVIQLTPAAPRSSAPARQYSADPEQYEGGTQRNLMPLMLIITTLTVVVFAIMALIPH